MATGGGWDRTTRRASESLAFSEVALLLLQSETCETKVFSLDIDAERFIKEY